MAIVIEDEKVGMKRVKLENKRENKKTKADERRIKKQNQEGVYRKLGPFAIKSWIIILIVVIVLISALFGKH